jgi:hypothetical protein
VLFPSLHLDPPHCDRVPGRASCLVLCLATLCVCVNVPVYAHKWVSVFLYGCVRPTALGGTGLPVCACARACACVSDSLLSLGMGAGPSLSLPHTLTHDVCGGAGGGTESKLGRLKHQQQRVHWLGDKGPLGAVRRLRHAWGGHREREARAAASGGVPCVSAMATKFNSAQQICQTRLIRDGTYLEYGPPLPPSRLLGKCSLSVGEYVCVYMCV